MGLVQGDWEGGLRLDCCLMRTERQQQLREHLPGLCGVPGTVCPVSCRSPLTPVTALQPDTATVTTTEPEAPRSEAICLRFQSPSVLGFGCGPRPD